MYQTNVICIILLTSHSSHPSSTLSSTQICHLIFSRGSTAAIAEIFLSDMALSFPHPAFISMSASPLSRRNALRIAGLSVAAICTPRLPHPAYALKPGKPSKEKLLSGLREEKTPEEIAEEKARVAEEKRIRLEKQRELQAEAARKKAGLDDFPPDNAEIESTLRGQYYFPTARKRYLPRVKMAWDVMPAAQHAADSEMWAAVERFSATEFTDAVLPMKLYASSLAGGGLNINAKFIEKMNTQTANFESSIKKLSKAVKRKEKAVVLATLTDMRGAIELYRKYGRLEAADFGIGEIPTENRVGSGFGNNNSSLYRRNKSVQNISQEQR